ncbi:hypothetical protein [Chroococcidiopsis sp.]|uniref:hypothetical protein n=1 Tax=Chroococcidiopsis sp. TaxID=3088168 RepID=UPI003F2B2375
MVFNSNKSQQLNELIPNTKEKITLGQLILAGAFIMLSFSSCTVALSNKKLAEQRITNVQLADGTAIFIQQKSGDYREPKVIVEFSKQWLSLMFGWERSDRGIKNSQNKFVPSNSYAASLTMATKFRDEFLNELAPMVPSQFFDRNNSLKSSILIRYISEPVAVKATVPTWKINVVADWLIFDESSGKQIKTKPFNKIFTIQAAAIPNSALGEGANSFEKLVNKMRAAGLEIISIENYDG